MKKLGTGFAVDMMYAFPREWLEWFRSAEGRYDIQRRGTGKGANTVGQGARGPRTQTEKTEIEQDMDWPETAGFPGLEISYRESGFRVRPRIPKRLRYPEYLLFAKKH